jgi:glycosyltransferase involved in cell wall biosynthesis
VLVTTLYWITLLACLITAVPVATIMIEMIAAIAPSRKAYSSLRCIESRGRVGVLIPAHNEQERIQETIANIQPQLRDGDWLLVVADNCSDHTAAVARAIGADVVVRSDPTNVGKGFALDFGIRQFAKNPPNVVIVVDADCQLGDLAVDHLFAVCDSTNRPVQALYTMSARRPTRPARPAIRRDLLPAGSVLYLGLRALNKIPLYIQIVLRRNRQAWIRTDRRKN